MLFERIFKALNKQKIKYLVVGGVAVNLHGYVRATGDLDIFLSMNKKNLRLFFDAVKFLGLKPRIPVALEDLADSKKRAQWVKEKGLKVFSLFHPGNPLESVDIMIECPLNFSAAYRKRDTFDAGELKISTVSIEDLFLMKQRAGRDRDRMDVSALRQIEKIKHESETNKK